MLIEKLKVKIESAISQRTRLNANSQHLIDQEVLVDVTSHRIIYTDQSTDLNQPQI
jgi:hypothetical protein